MRIALKYMGREHTFREKPHIIPVCSKAIEPTSARFKKIHVTTIPHGKRYFPGDPCRDHIVCNPLLAETATLQQLREMHQFGCCPTCKK